VKENVLQLLNVSVELGLVRSENLPLQQPEVMISWHVSYCEARDVFNGVKTYVWHGDESLFVMQLDMVPLGQSLFKPQSCGLLHPRHYVAVRVQGYGNCSMSRSLLHDLWMCTLL
jgi:hypothetical protein